MKAEDKDFFKEFTEYVVMHMMVGVKFTSIPNEVPAYDRRVTMEFTVPEYLSDKDEKFHKYNEIVDSLKTGFANICTGGDLKELEDMVNFVYTIRYGEVFTEADAKNVIRDFNTEIANIKELMNKRKR